MKKQNNKWLKTVSLGTVTAAGVVATALVMNLNSFAPSHQRRTYSPTNALNATASQAILDASGQTPFQPRAPFKAPTNLFTIDTPAQGQYQNQTDQQIFVNINDGLTNLGVGTDITDLFANAFLGAFINTFAAMRARFQDKITAGIKFFTDVNNIQKQFKAINQFNAGTAKELEIFAPNEIFNINEAGKPGSTSVSTQPNPSSPVMYRVASIALDSIKGQDKVLEYKLTVPQGTGSKEYNLLLNNNNNGIVKYLDVKSNPNLTNPSIKTLFDNGQIILRDLNGVTDKNSAIETVANKFILDYDDVNNKINIVANTDGISETNPLKFKASNSDTASITDIGFLDSSVSPINDTRVQGHTDFLSNNPVRKMVVHNMKVKQETTTNGGHDFYMWMAQDASIKLKVNYTPSPNSWSNGNEITLTFDGNDVVSTPSNLTLNKGTKAPTNGLLHFNSQKTTTDIGGVTYAKVHILTDDAEITVNNLADVRVPGKGDEKIFFEIPGNDETLSPNISANSVNHEVKISTSTDVTDKWREYINNVYGSWFDLNGSLGDEWKLPATLHQSDRVFEFNYEFYYQNNKGGIIKVPAGTKDALLSSEGDKTPEKELIVHDAKTFEPKANSAGKTDVIPASGKDAVQLLSDYFNHLTKWTNDKFGITNKLKGEDYYALKDPSDLDSIIKVIELNAPLSYSGLNLKADTLVKLAWQGYGALTSQQQRYVDSLDDKSDPNYNYLGIQNIKAKIDNVIGGSSTTNNVTGDISSWTPDMKEANHIIMMLLEKEIVSAVEEMMANENKTFEGIYSSLLGTAFALYLDGNAGTYSAISKDALQVIDQKDLDPDLAGEKIVALNNDPQENVNTGLEQLKSLLDFIYNFDLETRYLSKTKSDKFKQYYASGEIFDKNKYNSISDRRTIGEMISIIDEIVKKIVGGTDVKLIQSIVTEIEYGNIKSPEAAKILKETLNSVVDKITNPSGNVYEYAILSTSYSSSFLQNQVMGKNLSAVLRAWLKNNKTNLTPEQVAQLESSGLYNPNTLTNMAVSAGYYNFDYFIKSMTEAGKIPGTTSELLHSNFEDAIIFKIPESNSIIDFISNPGDLVKYGFIATGGLITITALSTLGISFTKTTKNSGNSKRSSMILKGLFLGVAVLGLLIAGIGLIAS